jgi:hypothetical protein
MPSFSCTGFALRISTEADAWIVVAGKKAASARGKAASPLTSSGQRGLNPTSVCRLRKGNGRLYAKRKRLSARSLTRHVTPREHLLAAGLLPRLLLGPPWSGGLRLRRVTGDRVHQSRRQTVIGLKAQLLQPVTDTLHLLRFDAGFDDRGNERRKSGSRRSALLE